MYVKTIRDDLWDDTYWDFSRDTNGLFLKHTDDICIDLIHFDIINALTDEIKATIRKGCYGKTSDT